MKIHSAGRLIVAALLSSGLVSAASAGDAGTAAIEPQATEPGSAAAAMPLAANPVPDADANRPDAPDQVFSYYMVSGATLRGRSSTVDSTYHSVGCAYLNSGTGQGLLLNSEAPIPDGSLIKYLRIYYYDTNAANGVSGFLTRYRPGVETTDLTFVASTAAFVGGYGTTLSPEISEVVDGDQYAYTVIGWPDAASASNRICGLRVAYYGPEFFANGFENPP